MDKIKLIWFVGFRLDQVHFLAVRFCRTWGKQIKHVIGRCLQVESGLSVQLHPLAISASLVRRMQCNKWCAHPKTLEHPMPGYWHLFEGFASPRSLNGTKARAKRIYFDCVYSPCWQAVDFKDAWIYLPPHGEKSTAMYTHTYLYIVNSYVNKYIYIYI